MKFWIDNVSGGSDSGDIVTNLGSEVDLSVTRILLVNFDNNLLSIFGEGLAPAAVACFAVITAADFKLASSEINPCSHELSRALSRFI